MLASILLFCTVEFGMSQDLHRQIALDRRGFSCNVIDGVWGAKSDRAEAALRASPESGRPVPQLAPFRIETVTQADLDALVKIPSDPAGKSKLTSMGYESIQEMFAERGHTSPRALERLNPGVDWDHIQPGLKLVIPDFPSIDEELAAGDRGRPKRPKRPEAALVKVSLSRFEITVYNASGSCIALFPCSIAKDKAKLPRHGELKITSYIAHPNYTYTPDFVPKGRKASRYVFPAGPNCPVGVAWMGLDLPGYGIHGTPHPETIGKAESHGCFRLANWNAARLYAMCKPGTKVIVEP